MRLATYRRNDQEQLAFLCNNKLYNTTDVDSRLPDTMAAFLKEWDKYILPAQLAYKQLVEGDAHVDGISYDEAPLLAPVPHPASCRDAYAFRQHVAAARRNRRVEMIPEFDEYPIFYFTNHQSVIGPGPIVCMPDHLKKLDFELEAAIVICKNGRNIAAAEADNYIGGYMIMNDVSARTLQMEEMKLNLGPAKGKDFCTVIGPILVTPDELESFKVKPKENHTGNTYNLSMTCAVNGVRVSKGNLADMDWTFAEIIERCSYGVQLYPGDVIGSGTVGTGCFLELNGTGRYNDPGYVEQWLQPGDEIVMEIEQLGVLKNNIIKDDSNFSILDLKKSRHSPPNLFK